MKPAYILVGGLVVLSAAIAWWLSREHYGDISDKAYELATATYGACMAKSEQRIDRVEALLDDKEIASQISEQEMRWFRSIIQRARSDNWTSAAKSAKQMMQDQVEY